MHYFCTIQLKLDSKDGTEKHPRERKRFHSHSLCHTEYFENRGTCVWDIRKCVPCIRKVLDDDENLSDIQALRKRENGKAAY